MNIAIIEDNPLFLEQLKRIIFSNDKDTRVCEYLSAEPFIRDCKEMPFNIVLMDINLPGMNGIEAIKIVKKFQPDVLCLALTYHDDIETIYEVLASGAIGYLHKNSNIHHILENIEIALHGGSPISSGIARKIIESLAPKRIENNILSLREMEILNTFREGFSYNETADKLNISLHTVRSHVRSIYEKLHVNSKTEALSRFFQKDA